MNNVAANINAEVTANGAWLGGQWVGSSDDLSSGLHDVLSFPAHGADWSGADVLDETTEERLGGEIGIVSLSMSLERREKKRTEEMKKQNKNTKKKSAKGKVREKSLERVKKGMGEEKEPRNTHLLDRHHLQTSENETSLLEPGDNSSDQSSLDAIRLDHNISSLGVGHGWSLCVYVCLSSREFVEARALQNK